MTYPSLFDADTGRFNGVIACLQSGDPEVFIDEQDFLENYPWLTRHEWGFVFFGSESSLERAGEVKDILEEMDDGNLAGCLEVRECGRPSQPRFEVIYRGDDQ